MYIIEALPPEKLAEPRYDGLASETYPAAFVVEHPAETAPASLALANMMIGAEELRVYDFDDMFVLGAHTFGRETTAASDRSYQDNARVLPIPQPALGIVRNLLGVRYEDYVAASITAVRAALASRPYNAAAKEQLDRLTAMAAYGHVALAHEGIGVAPDNVTSFTPDVTAVTDEAPMGIPRAARRIGATHWGLKHLVSWNTDGQPTIVHRRDYTLGTIDVDGTYQHQETHRVE
jgi:hypothetical protein